MAEDLTKKKKKKKREEQTIPFMIYVLINTRGPTPISLPALIPQEHACPPSSQSACLCGALGSLLLQTLPDKFFKSFPTMSGTKLVFSVTPWTFLPPPTQITLVSPGRIEKSLSMVLGG